MNIVFCVDTTSESSFTIDDTDEGSWTPAPMFTPGVAMDLIKEYYCDCELGAGDVRYFWFWNDKTTEFLGKFKATGHPPVTIENLEKGTE